MLPLANNTLPDTASDTAIENDQYSYRQWVYILVALSLACLFIILINKHIDSKVPIATLAIKQGFLKSVQIGSQPSELEYGVKVDVNALHAIHEQANKYIDNTGLNKNLTIGSSTPTNYWFTTLVELAVPPDRIWSIYTPYSSDNANFFVNGFQLGDVVNSTSRGFFERGRPSLISIPNGILKSGSNEIQIQFTNSTEINFSNADNLLLGPLSELSPYYQFVSFNTSSLPVFVLFLSGSLAL